MNIKGVSVCSGCVLEKIYVLEEMPEFDLTERSCLSVEETMKIVSASVIAIRESIQAAQIAYEEAGDTEQAGLMQVQEMMLEDDEFRAEIEKAVMSGYEAAVSVITGGRAMEEMLLSLCDDYMSARADDVRDLSLRIACHIRGISCPNLEKLPGPVIVIAKQLLPSMLMNADLEHMKGIVVEKATKTSHISILASSLQIPTIVACDSIDALENGEKAFLDADKGILSFKMTEEELEESSKMIKAYSARCEALASFESAPMISADKVRCKLLANIAEPMVLQSIDHLNFDGVGLMRSEFLFIERSTLPTEEEQLAVYTQAVKALKGKPLTIRTIDIGGDKSAPCLALPKEDNPFLGYRAVRICLDKPELIKTQLRAILRASAEGPIQIMFPMIATAYELTVMLSYLEELKKELSEKHIAFDSKLKLGIMVEIPSTVICLDQLLPMIDFVSIGSNDLVQYTYAADRLNEKVAYLNQYMHPAVLRLIYHTISTSAKLGKECSLCGEMAGDPMGMAVLAVLGLRKFSMSPAKLLRAKKLMSVLNISELERIRNDILQAFDAVQAESILRSALPEEYDI